MIEQLCMGCMINKGNAAVCPECGWREGRLPASNQHLPPGTLLSDRYCIGKVLGQGGFGITYLGMDTYLDLKLAIKEYFPRELVIRETGRSQVSIHSDTFQEQYNYALEKFLLEARTLARFEGHPNIISVRDFFKANGTAYLAMPYLSGMTLKEYLELKDMALSFAEVLGILMPVLDALRVIHGEGVLHRDISPDNIFITSKGRVILIDFGAARQAIGEKGKHLSVVLKPGYAPEEQYRSRGIQGPWTDIYAVAATFYRAVTGRMPPDSLDRLEDDPLLSPTRLGIPLGAEEEAALLKAFAVRAENRFQDVAHFQAALWPSFSGSSPPPTQASSVTYNGHYSPHWLNSKEGEPSRYVEHPYAARTEEENNPYSREDEAVHDPLPYAAWAINPQAAAEFGEQEIRIGRAPDNDIVLQEGAVSRYHARLYFQSGTWYVADGGSTHGTLLNGEQLVRPQEIRPGDRLQFSTTTLRFDGNNIFSEQGELLKSVGQPAVSAETTPPGEYPSNNFPPPNDLSGRGKAILATAAGGVLGLLLVALFLYSWFEPTTSPLTSPLNQSDEGAPAVLDDAVIDDEAEQPGETATIEFEGGIYTGQVKNGVPHGYGSMVYHLSSRSPGSAPRGERRYEGEWQDGKREGEGTMIYPDGTIRQGIWKDDVFAGH